MSDGGDHSDRAARRAVADGATGDDEALAFHPVTAARWSDLVALFEARGGPKACWCMVWRATTAEAKDTSGTARRSALEGRVKGGVPVGILGYRDGVPVAWCSIAPRETYRPMGGVDGDGGHAPNADPVQRGRENGARVESVWSVVCFFIPKAMRGQGIMPRLLKAAVEHARLHGATVVEAYPVDPDSPSYRFMGFVHTFEAAGFREVGRAGIRRHVMRLDAVALGSETT